MNLDPTADSCFVCGKSNQKGLRLDFCVDHELKTLSAVWTPEEHYQSFNGILHGGITAALLDEALGRLCYDLKIPAVTAQMNVRYIKPIPIGLPLSVFGRITEERGRMITGESQITLADSTLAASAELKYVRVKK